MTWERWVSSSIAPPKKNKNHTKRRLLAMVQGWGGESTANKLKWAESAIPWRHTRVFQEARVTPHCTRNPLLLFLGCDVSGTDPFCCSSKANYFPVELSYGYLRSSPANMPRLRRHLQCRYLRRWICLNDFFPGLGWDIFPSPFIFFHFLSVDFMSIAF